MPKSAGIIERRIHAVNGRATIGIVFIFFSMMLAACGKEHAASKLYTEGTDLVKQGDTRAAVERFERILREYPDTEIAGKARRDIDVYRGLSEAVEKFPQRRAREIIVQTARAIERFHGAQRRWPAALAELIPSYLDREPGDPWSRPLHYAPKPDGHGYELACLGADGARGGEGDDADTIVVNGAFVEGRP